MIGDVLEMAAHCDHIKAAIRAALPAADAEAVIVEGGRRSVYTATRADIALQEVFADALEALVQNKEASRPS